MPPIFPGSTKGGGTALAFPDVCKTPAPPAPFVPIPYPNIIMLNQGSGTASGVKFSGKECYTKGSKNNRSQGDEAGTLKGLKSMVNMDKAQPKKVSAKVKAKGKKCVHLVSMFTHNGSNSNMPAGCQIAPSQVKVIISP